MSENCRSRNYHYLIIVQSFAASSSSAEVASLRPSIAGLLPPLAAGSGVHLVPHLGLLVSCSFAREPVHDHAGDYCMYWVHCVYVYISPRSTSQNFHHYSVSRWYHGWRKKGIIHRGAGGAYLRCPVSTSVHFILRNEGSSEYIRLCEGRESLSPNIQTFQDPRHQFNGIGRLVLDILRIRIRDPVPFWPLDPGFGMDKKSGSGSGMNNPDHIS
jgi:hypothetical protein